MTSLLTRIFKKDQASAVTPGFEFVRFKKSLLNNIQESYRNGTAIGVYSDVLGEGMFVTGVEDIYEYEGDHIIQLKRYDVLGTILMRNTLSLSEIKAVCVFDMPYKNPHA